MRSGIYWTKLRRIKSRNIFIMKKIVLLSGLAALVAAGLVGQPVKTGSVRVVKDTIPGHHPTFSPLNITTSNDGELVIVKVKGTDEKGNVITLKEVGGKVMEF